ncbi:hypothetical protein MMC29_004370, partial [Sticta canariensis]|nr:hypothetical protein [Sticta canariensis]
MEWSAERRSKRPGPKLSHVADAQRNAQSIPSSSVLFFRQPERSQSYYSHLNGHASPACNGPGSHHLDHRFFQQTFRPPQVESPLLGYTDRLSVMSTNYDRTTIFQQLVLTRTTLLATTIPAIDLRAESFERPFRRYRP